MIPPSFFALDSFLMIRASTLVTSSQDVPLRSREVLSLSTHRQWKWRRLSKWKWTTIIITKTERSRSIFQVPLSTLLLLKTHETALLVGVFFGQQDALLYIPLYWRKFSAIFYFYFVDPPFSNSLVLRTLSSTCGTLVLVLALLLLAFTLAPRHTASPCESSRASLTTNNNWHKPNDGKLFLFVCQKKSTKHDGVALQRAKAEHRTQHLISSCN